MNSEPKPLSKEKIRIFLRKIGKYRKIFSLILILIFIFSLPLLPQILFRITIFNIDSVKIVDSNGKELKYVSEEQISQFSESILGKNYFTLKTEDIKSDIVKFNPFVKSSIVSKEFPNGIVINVLEREPLLTLNISDERCVILDSEGYTLQEIEQEDCMETLDIKTVPLTLADSKVVFKQGEQSTFYLVKDILKVIKVFEEYKIETVSFKIVDDILTVNISSKRAVFISLNQSIDLQLQRFISIANQIITDDMKFKTLDLRYNRPVLKNR